MHFSWHEYTEYIFFFSTNSPRLFKAKATPVVSNLLCLITLRRVVQLELGRQKKAIRLEHLYVCTQRVTSAYFNIFLQPHVDDVSEQEKYMSYVSNMTEKEAKHLLLSCTHRLIDVRCQGLDNDRKNKEMDENFYGLMKSLKRKDYQLKVLKSEYDVKFMKEERKCLKKIADVTLKTESQLLEKDEEIQRILEENKQLQKDKEKYKGFYNLYLQKRSKGQIEDIMTLTTPVKSSGGGGHRTQEKKITVEASRSSKPSAKTSSKRTAVVYPNNSQADPED